MDSWSKLLVVEYGPHRIGIGVGRTRRVIKLRLDL